MPGRRTACRPCAPGGSGLVPACSVPAGPSTTRPEVLPGSHAAAQSARPPAHLPACPVPAHHQGAYLRVCHQNPPFRTLPAFGAVVPMHRLTRCFAYPTSLPTRISA